MNYIETFEDTCFDYEASGFQKYTDQFRKDIPGVKQACYQKKIKDTEGVMFFINVHVFDLSNITNGNVGTRQELNVQFHTQDNMMGEHINVNRMVNSPSDAIDKTEEMWQMLKCGYYEKY